MKLPMSRQLRQSFSLIGMALFLAMATHGWAVNSYADSLILVKATEPWSVTGKSDVQQLKHLASGVGWDFGANAATTAGLKELGIKTVRCINVGLPGHFDKSGKYRVDEKARTRIFYNLATCREIGASPHICIANASDLEDELRVTAKNIPDSPQKKEFMGNVTADIYGPSNWEKFQNWCEAYFEYVIITQKFPDARFEVGNEPDIGGSFVPFPPKPARGSAALYDAYFKLYQNVAEAAGRFEKNHPGVKVKLGGPALAWAFTFKFGDFNWSERFLRDCSEKKVKLDFIGLHSYGNLCSLNGEYPANYPSFKDMLKTTLAARDRYCPGVPVWFTEWGASYNTDASINADHVGAAWTAAFLNTLLENRVDGALYLVTTDLLNQAKDGKGADIKSMGWPALFMNPDLFDGRAVPKAPCHVFSMISRLEGERCESSRGAKSVNSFVSADKNKHTITAIIWNYDYRIPEIEAGVENAQREGVIVRVRDAAEFFGTGKVKVERWLVGKTTSDAYNLFLKGGKSAVDGRAELQKVDSGSLTILDGSLDAGFAMPPSSVSFLVLSAE